MINIKKSSFVKIALVVGVILCAASAMPAYAQTANQTARVAKIITRSDTAITSRITALNNLSTRVGAMVNVDATTKANINSQIQTNVTGLTALKAKIDSETDVTTLLSDEKTITGNYRIYALIIPRGYIVASSDRITTINGLMTALSTKLQTRITTAQSAGHDVAALQTDLNDLNAKIADATAQGQTALSGVVSLVPDQGNQTQLQSNTAALKASRADIKTATKDFQAARQDAKNITAGLKGI